MNVGEFYADRLQRSVVKTGAGTTGNSATATKAAVAGRCNVVCKAIGSYSGGTGVGTLTVKFGTTAVAIVDINNNFAMIDLGDVGVIDGTVNEAVSAVVSAATGVTSNAVLVAYDIGPPA